MDQLVEVLIPVEADVAEKLTNAHQREAIGRMIGRMLRPDRTSDPLLDAMDRFSVEAKRRGITQEILDKELAVYNSERRGRNDIIT